MAWSQHAIVGHIPPRNTSTLTHPSPCLTTLINPYHLQTKELYASHLLPNMGISSVRYTSPPTSPNIADQQQQLMKAAFPMGFISMEPKSHNSSISTNMTQKALKPSGAVNQGNDTYNFYDGGGGDGWPSMDKWVDFYSM